MTLGRCLQVRKIFEQNKPDRLLCKTQCLRGPKTKQNKTKQNKRPALLSGFFAIEFTKQDASFVKPPGVHIYKTKHQFHQHSFGFVQCRM